MKLKSQQQYEARAAIAKALAHPSRLLMLDAMQQGDHCVNDLAELVEADQSTVSKHLGVLRQAGLVEDHKEGSRTYYRLRVKCLEGFWGCVESVLKDNLSRHRDAVGTRSR